MIRSQLRGLKARAIRYRETARPIVVMGLRRGGSTMVTDAIAASPGVWFADEPYAMFDGRPGMPGKAERLFVPMHSHFFGLAGYEAELWNQFGTALLRAEYRDMGTCRRTTGFLSAHRTCHKVLNAPYMLSWFRDRAEVLTLLRHPGAQAQSCLRQGWDFAIEAYLARHDFLEQHFTPAQVALAQKVFRSGDRWRIAVLDWIVSSHPLRRAEGVITLKYEDIVADPEDFVQRVLVDKLALADAPAMKAAVLAPSGSSRMNTASGTAAIEARDITRMTEGWRAKTSEDDRAAGQELLDLFEVDSYRFT